MLVYTLFTDSNVFIAVMPRSAEADNLMPVQNLGNYCSIFSDFHYE